MPDQDPLAGRFAAFRKASIATTQPPGVAAVQRAVVRRRAGRTLAAAAAAAVVLVIGTVLWVIRPAQSPRPAQSASPPPSSVVSATPTPTGQSTPSTSASPSLAQTSKVPAQAAPPCSPFTPGGLLELLVNESNQLYVAPSDYFSRCPQARIRVYGARYQWDVNGQQYTLAHIDTVYLTAASPTAPMPPIDTALLPGLGCGYAFVIAQSSVNPPGVYPASLESAPTNIDSYWSQHNLGYVLSWLANTYTPAQQAKSVGCQPPGGPTASATP
jgi:hypothetical protein